MSFSTPFVAPNTAPTTVGQIINNQVAYASYAIENANEFLGELQGSIVEDAVQVDADDYSNPSFAVVTLGNLTALLNAVATRVPTVPTLEVDNTATPAAPTDFTFSDTPDVTVPEFEAVSPTLDIPATPAGAETISLPSEIAVEEPQALDALVDPTLPTVPSFATLTIPTAPTLEVPVFDPAVEMPAAEFTDLTNNFSWAEAAYSSTVLDAAQAKLLYDLQNGGYGLDTTDEDALWERERARQIEATNFAIDEIARDAAMRGFPMPPGDLNVSVQRAVQDASNKLSSVSRDIALKRADMYVENRKFTLQEVRALETVLIGFHNSRMERALNASKAVVELGVQVFNASVAKHNARLDAYKAEQAVYESKIRAALLQVEGYRNVMEGKKLELQSQTQQVELYRAQLAGVNALIEIYKTKAEVHREKVNIQRLRLDIFRGRVDAYSAQVQGKIAVMQAHEARIRGETAKVAAYEAEARAFIARVDGVKARTDALLASLKVETEQAQARVRTYEAEITGFRAEIDRQASINRDKTSLYGAQVQEYDAVVRAYAESARTGIAQERLSFDMRAKAIDAVIENAKVQLTALAKSADIRVATNNTTGDFMKVTVGAALGALNTISADIRNT